MTAKDEPKKAELRKKRTASWRRTEGKPATPTAKHPKAPKGVTNAQLADAIQKTAGMLGDVARAVGIKRQTLHARVKRSPALQELLAEAREETLDLAESKLVEAIRGGNLGAICFYLRTQGRSRGYVERSEVATTEGEPIRFYLPKKAELPPDDEPLATMVQTPVVTAAG